jgi:serine/threonine-protein kinase
MLPAEDKSRLGLAIHIGDCIAGKYLVVRALGKGAMGVVFEAKHLALRQSVAIKFLLPEHAAMATASSRFLCEARAAGRIRSEHVTRILDTDVLPSGLPYIVMEFLSGMTLAECLQRRGRLAQKEAVDLLLQAAVGVAEAHAAGIVHRDLKPANLFVTTGSDRQPLVKVLDFGISKIRDNQADGAITHRDSVLGSPHYMSPEQMRAPDSVDERSDIWSLGVILFELLSGNVPFPGRTLLAIFTEGLKAPDLSLQCPEIPPELAAVVMRCLARQRSERFGCISELARALLPFGSRAAVGSVERINRIAGGPNEPLSSRANLAIGGPSRRRASWIRSKWGVALLAMSSLAGFVALLAVSRHRGPEMGPTDSVITPMHERRGIRPEPQSLGTVSPEVSGAEASTGDGVSAAPISVMSVQTAQVPKATPPPPSPVQRRQRPRVAAETPRAVVDGPSTQRMSAPEQVPSQGPASTPDADPLKLDSRQ